MLKIFTPFIFLLLPFFLHAQGTWTVFDSTNSPITTGTPLWTGGYAPIFAPGIHNDVWVVGNKNLLHMDSAGNWTTYDTSNGMPGQIYIYDITTDAAGKVYMYTHLIAQNMPALLMFDGANFTLGDTANSPLCNGGFYKAIAVDYTGNVWMVGCDVFMFDGTWHDYNFTSVNATFAPAITVDVFNNVWIGTILRGLLKYDQHQWTVYPGNIIASVGTDVFGHPWINVGETIVGGALLTLGLSHFNGVNWIDYYNTNPFTSGFISNVAVDRDNVKWFGQSGGGLVRLGNTVTVYDTLNSGLPNTKFDKVKIDKAGNKWISTQYKLVKFSDGGAGSLQAQHLISGRAYFDMNANGQRDTLEPPMADHVVELQPGSLHTLTNAQGYYAFNVDTGTYTVTISPRPLWTISSSPDTHTVLVVDTNSITSGLNFGLHTAQNYTDVSISLSTNLTRCFSPIYAAIDYRNDGFALSQGTITLQLDTLTGAQTDPPYSSKNGSTYIWNYANLAPGEQRRIRIFGQVIAIAGDTLHYSATIAQQPADSDTSNNIDSPAVIVRCAYDPNDKLVTPAGTGAGNYTPYGEELQYTIRFQNTGNDTAFEVVVRDTLEANLNVPSFRVLASSHPMVASMQGEGALAFTFHNIMLPDSNVNEPASHGFVKFAVAPKAGLPDSTEVRNTAAIYFDFNQPVITNTTLNTFVQPRMQLSSENDILNFAIPQQTTATVIDTINHTVTLEVAFGTSLAALTPTVVVSANATVVPSNNVTQNFTNPVTYTVTAQDGSVQAWTVTVTVAPGSSAKNILLFSLPQQTGPATIDSIGHIISIEVLPGTNVTALTPTITVSPNATVSPASGVPENFANPVIYTVTAQDGSLQGWAVTVTVSSGASIISFTLAEQTGPAVIDAVGKTVTIEVMAGTNRRSLLPTITLSPGASILLPPPGIPQDFTQPVMYLLSGSASFESWMITVTIPGDTANDILYFTLPQQTRPATIDVANHTVDIEVLPGSDLTSLSPTVTVSQGATVYPASGLTQNFMNPVLYTVTSGNGTEQQWTVDVTTGSILRGANEILDFSLPQQIGTATIDAMNHTVEIAVAQGTDVAALTPSFIISSGATASPASGVVQDFTNAVNYTVTAENGTPQTWEVTVAVEVPSGIHTIANEHIAIFPNPATDKVMLQSTIASTWNVSICDLSGKRVVHLQNSVLPLEIDVANLPEGVFLLQMVNEDGVRLNEKLVIGER